MNAMVLWTLGILAGMGLAPVWANDGVQLVLDKAVYKAGADGAVNVAVKNTGTVNLKVMSWAVQEGTTVVYSPASLGSVTLKPGQTKRLQWSKKSSHGKWGKAGSYQIKVGPILGATHSGLYHSATVALTPSGKLAGNSRFPLEVGDYVTSSDRPGHSHAGVRIVQRGPTLHLSMRIFVRPVRSTRTEGYVNLMEVPIWVIEKPRGPFPCFCSCSQLEFDRYHHLRLG